MASNPCKQSEAMAKISNLVELPIVCLRSSLLKPEVPPSGFSFLIPPKSPYHNCQRNEYKNQPFFTSKRNGWVKNSEYFIGGSILVSKGGSIQMGVKASESLLG